MSSEHEHEWLARAFGIECDLCGKTPDEVIAELEQQLAQAREENAALDQHRWQMNDEIIIAVDAYIDEEIKRKAAYKERDLVLALLFDSMLARGLHCWLGRHPDNEEWENDWRNIVYAELPNGQQLSWHIHDSEVVWFPRLAREDTPWDGHTTEEKYRRLLEFVGAEIK